MPRIAMKGDDTGLGCLNDGALTVAEVSTNVTAGGKYVALDVLSTLKHTCNGAHGSPTLCGPNGGSLNIKVNGESLHREEDLRLCGTHQTATSPANIAVNVFCNE